MFRIGGFVMGLRPAIFGSIATASVAISTCAFAADLPTSKPPPPPPIPAPAPFSWTGFYIGGYAGGSFGTAKTTDLSVPGTQIGSPSLSSFTGGGLVGYNYQFSSLVVGAEGEFGFDDRSGSSTYLSGSRSAHFDGDYIGRIRGRAGVAFNNFLVYGAGGVSFANGTLKNTNNVAVPPFSLSVSNEFTGWNVGGGVEYAFTSNWIVRGEYIFDELDRETYNFGYPAPFTFDTKQVNLYENTVRAAVEYKF
jgi:outer membrane immunogenic protein